MKFARVMQILAVNIICCAMVCAQSSAKSKGKVRGSIYDPTGNAVIPGMRVVVEGEGVKRVVTTNENGEYEFDLPAGIYKITTEQGWYYPLKRAAFRVRGNTTSAINLYPAIRTRSVALEVTSSGVNEPATYASPPKYDTFSSGWPSPLTLVIEFDKRKARRGVVEYRHAKLTYGVQTISAETLLFDRKNYRIEASGNVLLDDNGQRRRAAGSLRVNLKKES